MMPDLANDPAVQAAMILNRVNTVRVSLKDKLLFIAPLPIGCYFLAKGLLLGGDAGGDPTLALAGGLVRGLESLGGFMCFYVSLRAYFKIKRTRRGSEA